MSQQHGATTGTARPRTPHGRVGIAVEGSEPSTLVATTAEAEAAGVEQIWMYRDPVSVDALTLYAAAPPGPGGPRRSRSRGPAARRAPPAPGRRSRSVPSRSWGRPRRPGAAVGVEKLGQARTRVGAA